MFNPLLERQIKKHLAQLNGAVPQTFFAAINDAYKNYEDQIAMLQRAMKLSSDELFEANTKLREETQLLKEVNNNLEAVLNSLNIGATPLEDKTTVAEHIKRQALEIVEINKQREELLKSLEQQNQELNEYAHMVSHDLKSPLRNINTLIEWFINDNKENLKEDSLKNLDLILLNVEKMDLLIKGILDYSSIDRFESEDRPVDFNVLIQEIERTSVLPKNFEIKINTKLPKIYGNYFRFKQLFENLINNAIKYNDKENGVVEIGAKPIGGNYIEFYVKDNGIGIDSAYFDKIFNIFTKLSSKDNSSGIGLSIVKKIVQFYNGTIRVESTLHEGTTFYFTLHNGKT
jgi:light-regulated signal transduction histidine kinase (bacteriophytochrome)